MTTPIWQQIHQTLTREIAEGHFAAGAKLPTEAALSQRFGVNRHTVRRALSEMQGAGLVHSRRGAGVFVTGAQVTYRVGPRTRFSQNLRDSGHVGDREIIRLDTVAASEAEARRLEITRGDPIHILEAIGTIDGTPALFGQSIFPAGRLAGFPDTMRESHSITAALKACGVGNYSRAWTRLTAERVTGTIARHLRISEGAPVMRAKALNRSDDGWPVEYARTTFCADRVELLIEGEGSEVGTGEETNP